MKTILIIEEPSSERSFWLHVPDIENDPLPLIWPSWATKEEAVYARDLIEKRFGRHADHPVSKTLWASMLGDIACKLTQKPIEVSVRDERLRIQVGDPFTWIEREDCAGRKYWHLHDVYPGDASENAGLTEITLNAWISAFVCTVSMLCGVMPDA